MTQEDWAEIDHAFLDNKDPLFGDKAKAEFRDSWHSLMAELSTIVRSTCRAPNAGDDAPTFEITTTPTPKQKRALELIGQIKP